MPVTLPSGWSNFASGCTECIDTSERGQQIITIETAFDLVSTGVGDRTSWSTVIDGEFYALLGLAACGGGNMNYTNTCCQIVHYTNDNPTVFEVLPLPVEVASAPAINCRIGNGDVFAHMYGSPNMNIWYDVGSTPRVYGSAQDRWGVFGSKVYVHGGTSSTPEFRIYNKATQALEVTAQPFGSGNNLAGPDINPVVTDNYWYWARHDITAGNYRLYRLDKATAAVVSYFDISFIPYHFICVASDDLIYIICDGTPASVYYIKNWSELIFVGKTVTGSISPFGLGGAVWDNGTLYYGSQGAAGFSVNIFKIEIVCPDADEAILVASVTTEATVAAGAAINVSWADVLVTAVSDKLIIKPAPPAGVYGLYGSTIAEVTNTSATQSGTTSITIPGATTPGNYVAMYATNSGGIWVAQSTAFTVT